MKMTSAYANKLLKSLADEKSYWEAKEATSRTYVAAVGEEPVIPEYDYSAVSETLKEIDRKTVIIKHALNLANATAKIMVGDTEMSVDSILVRMAQLNSRKATPVSYTHLLIVISRIFARLRIRSKYAIWT